MTKELSTKATEIIAHTRSLLETGGYNSFSYADISAKVHISKASIHHHFPSKAELVRVVVSQYREEAIQGMMILDQQLNNSLEKLSAYAGYWSKCINESTSSFCICALLAVEIPIIPTEITQVIRDHFQDLINWLTSILEEGHTKGELQLQDAPAVTAQAFMATIHGSMLAARALGDPSVFSSLIQVTINNLTPRA